jgi:NADPH:quinone reductase-like Zn-dependent oxidoreductase
MADAIPAVMRAQLLTGHGGLDKLVYRDDVAVPEPAADEVLIHVRACGCNNTDINTRTAWYSRTVKDGTTAEGGAGGFDDIDADGASWGRAGIQFPRIQGADAVGHVVAVGADAPADLIGRRVLIDTWIRDWSDPENMDKAGYFGSEFDGGYADYTKVPFKNVHPIDSDLTDVELATFATSYVTAENMLHQAKVAAGDVVLIPGASGGVGSALIQLAHRRGAKTIALCGASKRDQVAALGPMAVLEREPADLGAAIKDATGLDSVDVVADVVGGPMFPQFLEVLRRGGRYTCAGAIAGPIVELDLRTFYLKDLVFTGATVVPLGLFENLVGYIAAGDLKPLVAATFPLRDLAKAQEMFLAKTHIGNIVIDHTLA